MGLLIGLALASAALLVILRVGLRAPSLTAGMRVIGRLPLEPRRSIYLVEVEGRRLVVGVGDGPMALLSELPPAETAAIVERREEPAPPQPRRVVDDWRRAWQRVVGGRA